MPGIWGHSSEGKVFAIQAWDFNLVSQHSQKSQAQWHVHDSNYSNER